MNRRKFLSTTSAALAAITLARAQHGQAPKRILLRSSWQVVNIGDIAHTPGVLALLEKYLPEAEVILWASPDLSDEVIAMEHRRFPKLRVVKGIIGGNGIAKTPELEEAINWCDFFLHGSGASVVARKDLVSFVKKTGKPFGVYGITYTTETEEVRNTLSQAKFVFFRETVSLAKAKEEGVHAPVMEFGPDGAFATDLVDEAAATKFIAESQLEEGKFLCCIPRLRWSPYWKMRPNAPLLADKNARNEEMKEHDHAPLRAAITRVVQESPMKVLICAEDVSQVELGREMLYEPLPAAVKERVVWRSKFWLTDEALSVYRRSAGLFGLEMHSPIMCVGHGVPAIVARFAEQTTKGFMWRDIGLGEWLFNFDEEADIARFPETVLSLAKDPTTARAKTAKARAVVEQRQRETMGVLARSA